MSAPRPLAGWYRQWRALPQRWRQLLLVLAASVLLALLAALLLHNALGRWLWPDPRYDALRQRAELALQAGKLSAADGSGARELFEAALALQPDQLEAREGLERVAQAAMARADAQIGAGDVSQAQAALQLAQALQAPTLRTDALAARVQAMQLAGNLGDLLAKARAAHAVGHLDGGPDAALPLYQEILQTHPRNQQALEGREDALGDLLRPAAAALVRGQLPQVADLIQRAERFDLGFSALPALHAGLAHALEQRGGQVRQLLARRQVGAAVRVCQPLRAITLQPLPEPCVAPLGDALLHAANAAVADFRLDEAKQLLVLASEAGVAPDRLQQVQRHLLLASRTSAHLMVASTPRGKAHVTRLLQQAAVAQSQEHWLTPLGESAWDRLREARALAPNDPRVQHAVQAMQLAAHACHATAMRDNNLGRARECLDAWRQLAPNEPVLLSAQRRLAERWLAVGDERLRAGDVRGARTALERAQQVDPGVPGSEALAQRLQRIPSALK